MLSVYRYIELNPVSAGIVSRASDYPWSSYRGNAVGKRIELLTPHRLYWQLGKTDEERQAAYRALFRGRMSKRELTAIREATNKACVLGSDRRRRWEPKRDGTRLLQVAVAKGNRLRFLKLRNQ